MYQIFFAAGLIRSYLRKNDILGRLGGDEFLAILTESTSDQEAAAVCRRLQSAFSKPFDIKGRRHYMSCSIGISRFPEDAKNAKDLTKMADIAMYRAKQKGKNSYEFFEQEMEQGILKRIDLENRLREAIETNQFVLHFQPKISLVDNLIVGIEALIRWQIPDGKLLYPDSFIEIAENTGLIRYITQWVIQTACKKLDSWKNTILKDIPISVNISAIDIGDKEFISDVQGILREVEIQRGLLEFELTESVFMHDIDYVKKIISELKAQSIMLSIDDFGTGYSSFSYLQSLDVDFLKIDRSFVQNVHMNSKSAAIVKSIIDLGNHLGLAIVAEGTECKEECDFLLANSCTIVQGYYFSKPITETALFEYQKKLNAQKTNENKIANNN